MNKILIIISSLIVSANSFSQETLRIVYEQSNFNPIPESQLKDANFKLAANMYNDRTYEFELFIRDTESLWKRIPHIQEEGVITIDGQWYMFNDPDNSTYYRNLRDHSLVYSVSDKQAVVDSIKNVDWEIEREKQQYFGYEVRKATLNNGYSESEALFTTDLSYSAGPWRIGDLPGLILYYKITLDDGFSMEYKVKNIDFYDKVVNYDIFDNFEIIDIESYRKKDEERSKKWKEMHDVGVDTSE